MQRLSAACGNSAVELNAIDDDLDQQIAYAKKFKDDCLNEFYGAFKEEGQTFVMYAQAQQTAFEEAKTAGEIPENPFTVDLPESPDTCAHYTDTIEAEIAMKVDELIELKDCTNFLIHDTCSSLGEEVDQILADNQSIGEATSQNGSPVFLDPEFPLPITLTIWECNS